MLFFGPGPWSRLQVFTSLLQPVFRLDHERLEDLIGEGRCFWGSLARSLALGLLSGEDIEAD